MAVTGVPLVRGDSRTTSVPAWGCASLGERARQCAHTPVTVGWEGERLTHLSKRPPRDLSVLFVTSQSSGVQTCRPACQRNSLAGRARWPGGDAQVMVRKRSRGRMVVELPTAVNECETLFHLPTATSVRLIFKWKFWSRFFLFFFLTFFLFPSSWKLNSWLKTAALIVPRRFCRFFACEPINTVKCPPLLWGTKTKWKYGIH